jgi:hypothetical protein
MTSSIIRQRLDLVATDIGRYQRVIGDALHSRTEGRQTTEVAIAVTSLNRMLELGRPEYARLTSAGVDCVRLSDPCNKVIARIFPS